jgi:ribosome maturation protein SDO1
MRVRVTVPATGVERFKTRILEGAETVENEDAGEEDWVAVSLLHVIHFLILNRPDTPHRSGPIPSHQ